MLVYFVNHSTAPVSLGGAERSLIALVEQWQRRDPSLEPFFITKAPRGRFIDEIERRGWPYRAFRFRGWATPHAVTPRSEDALFARGDYRATLDMIDLLTERRPQLVVTNTLVAPWGALAAAVAGVPHAWMVREYGDLDHGLTFETSRAATLADIGLMSAEVLVNSRALRDHLAEYMPIEKLTIAYPQLDAAPATPTPPPRSAELAITMVGRISASKGQWRAVEALGLLRERGITARLTVVGAAEQSDHLRELKSRAARLGVSEQIVWTGEQADPRPMVDAAAVCLTLSDREAFGRSTLEYLLAGRAVIATTGGGSDELVADGETGYLVDENPASLADRLAEYAANPELAAAHGAAGAEWAARFVARADGAAAIEALQRAARAEAYRLPQLAIHWFERQAHPRGRRRDAVVVVLRRATRRLLGRR